MAKAVGGYARPWAGPQMWVSDPLARDHAPRLELDWARPVSVGEIALPPGAGTRSPP